MPAGFLVGVLVPGQAADHVTSFLDRLFHQFGGAGIAHYSFLRESDDLDAAIFLHLLAREQKAAGGPQSADGSDIAEQPKEPGAVLHALLDGAHGARSDLGRIVLALEVVGDLDRFGQRARNVRPHDLAKEALVRMIMQIEQAGQNQLAASIDLL